MLLGASLESQISGSANGHSRESGGGLRTSYIRASGGQVSLHALDTVVLS